MLDEPCWRRCFNLVASLRQILLCLRSEQSSPLGRVGGGRTHQQQEKPQTDSTNIDWA